ncbi:MAG: hypothetical protein ACHQ4H_05415 [Ktedonobacterales bacterium]
MALPGTAVRVPAADVLPRLSVIRRDPVARVVHWLFAGRGRLIFWAVLLVDAVSMYGFSALDGTLVPHGNFDAALTDINSGLIWLALVPIAAIAYLYQLDEIPELFATLQRNGVTGLTSAGYERFVADCDHWYNHWLWAPLALLCFAFPWMGFMQATAQSPHTWYYPPAVWPWLIFCAIQYVEIYAVLMYALRCAVTCLQLRKLLLVGAPWPQWLHRHGFQRPAAAIAPQFLHPDGLGGFGAVLRFVLRSLVIGGWVLIVVTLESMNTSRTVSHFGQGSGLAAFIVVAALYATAVPALLFYPLRVTLAALRDAKHRLALVVSRHENAIVWARVAAVERDSSAQREEHVGVLIGSLRPLGDINAALNTVPESLIDLGRRSSQLIVLATVAPPLIAIMYRIASDAFGWNWDALIRQLLLGH